MDAVIEALQAECEAHRAINKARIRMNAESEQYHNAILQALKAAKAFIDSHVCDPDITAEMIQAWTAYQDALVVLPDFIKAELKIARIV